MAESRFSSGEIEAVRELIRKVRAGQAQDPITLAEAQERGFGVLMSLEAQLQRAQRTTLGTGDVRLVSPETRAETQELMDAIIALTEALTELRGLSSPEGGPSRVGYGFVLPRPSTARPRKPAGA